MDEILKTYKMLQSINQSINQYSPSTKCLNVPVRLLGPGAKQEIALVNLVPWSLTGTTPCRIVCLGEGSAENFLISCLRHCNATYGRTDDEASQH
jgi:hypothetical protein